DRTAWSRGSDRRRPRQPAVAIRTATAPRSRRDLYRGRAGNHLRRTDRAVPRPVAIDRYPQPSHPAGDLESAWQPAAESYRGRGRAKDGGGGDDPLSTR